MPYKLQNSNLGCFKDLDTLKRHKFTIANSKLIPDRSVNILNLMFDITVQWNSGRIKKLGWTYTEDLLCVQDDGTVLVYDIFLNFKRQFGMGQVSWFSMKVSLHKRFTQNLQNWLMKKMID